MTDTIKAFLEADYNKCYCNSCYSDPTGASAYCENGDFYREQMLTLAPAIRTLQERLEKLEAKHNSALADIEMAREAFTEIKNSAGSLEHTYKISKQALSALDKYKGGV